MNDITIKQQIETMRAESDSHASEGGAGEEMSEPTITPIHLWTHAGTKVRLLKCTSADGRGYGGLMWPESGTFRCPIAALDRESASKPDCESGGLFGWPWGVGIGGGKHPEYGGKWIVFECDPADVVDLGDKAKCVGEVEVIFCGDWWLAWALVLNGAIAWTQHAASGAASATGDSGAASATGYSGAASATGYSGAASATGDSGAASATGYRGAASATGDSGAASATGVRGAASATGVRGAASATGRNGIAIGEQVMGGDQSVLVALYWHNGRRRAVVGHTNVDGILPNTWYAARDGRLEVIDQVKLVKD